MKQLNRLSKDLTHIALAATLVFFSGCDSYVDRKIKEKEKEENRERLHREALNTPFYPDLAAEQTFYNHTYAVLSNTNIPIERRRFQLKIERELLDVWEERFLK